MVPHGVYHGSINAIQINLNIVDATFCRILNTIGIAIIPNIITDGTYP